MEANLVRRPRWLRAGLELDTGSGWRVPALDGLRGCAALSVFVSHLYQYGGLHLPLVHPWFAYAGQGGVMLFFALSGFLLYLPWVRALSEGSRPPALGDYAKRRVLRIVPAYYVSVVALAAIAAARGTDVTVKALALHLLFLPLFADVTLLSVFWSLQVEEFFYWGLPALHRLRCRIGSSATVWLASVASVAFAMLVLAAAPRRHWEVLLTQTPFYLPAFLLGMAGALAWARSKTSPRVTHQLALGVCGYLVISQIATRVPWPKGFPITPFANIALAPFMTLTVLAVARGAAPLLARPTIRAVGLISYSLYLWHLVLIKELPLALAAMLALPVAALSFLAVERPFLLLRPRAAPTVLVSAPRPASDAPAQPT